MFANIPKSPSATHFSSIQNDIANRNIRGLPSTARRVISPAKMELLAAQRRFADIGSNSSHHSQHDNTPEHHQMLGTRQRDVGSEYDERPKKRSRTIGERVGEAVYNTAVLAGGIGVAAYRYWKGGNDGDAHAHAQHASAASTSTSFSPDQRIPGAFNFRETDRDEDYVDIVDNNVRPSSGTSTPTRTPRKKMYRVNSRYRTVQSPKSVAKSGKNNSSSRKGGSKKSNTDDNDESSRLDSMSAQLSAMIADGQKALTQPAQLDEEDLQDDTIPPSSSFTFTQSLPHSRSDYSIGEGLRAAASLYSK
ncbi:hypothetical protein E3P99_00931 [Wallemia hederae]|uniref:Uncharacterized protein n=1 Tax=Wallemia hederae TaxID=1540922 RepID=A0A4T0FSJ3_9BASI|nr:hypothetical protein E3P99_00931 [Wallemia hederae]